MADRGGYCQVERIDGGATDVPARTEVLLLAVHGMGCVSCANRVHNALVLLPGVVGANVALGSRAARVEYDPERTDPQVLVQAVEDAGGASGHRYSAAPIPPAASLAERFGGGS
jgi:Cu+-exporting ATPase